MRLVFVRQLYSSDLRIFGLRLCARHCFGKPGLLRTRVLSLRRSCENVAL